MKSQDELPKPAGNFVDRNVSPAVYGMTAFLLLITITYFFFRDVPIIRGHALQEYEYFAPILGSISVLLYLGIYLYGGDRLSSFLARHDTINDAVTLEEFKSIIRIQTKLVYPVLLSALIAIICGLTLVLNFGLVGAIFLAVFHLVIKFTSRIRALESRMRSLPVTEEALNVIYKDLLIRWRKNLWPDF